MEVKCAPSVQDADLTSSKTTDLLVVTLDGRVPGEDVAQHIRRAQFRGRTLVIYESLAERQLSQFENIPEVQYARRPVSPSLLDRLLEEAALQSMPDKLLTRTPDLEPVHGLVGRSKAIRDIFTWVDKVGPSDASVCIHGESGTGKELIARALHQSSPRRDRRLVTLDCTAVPDGLMESHLFGHVKGAFTGAVETREGVFSLAHTGTLFIDELCELSLPLQAKLLRVIQSREFVKVGGSKPIRTDIRLITATNKDPKKEVGKGTFRQDLYYRVAVVTARVPPLRERREDIPMLVEHFVRKFSSLYGKQVRGVASAVMEHLVAAPWPGNVRQLEHFIEQATVLADGTTITTCELADDELMRPKGVVVPLPIEQRLPLREVERRYILDTLQHVRGNRSQAARILGISIRCLQYKIKEYSLDQRTGVAAVGDGGSGVMHLRRV